MSRKRAAERIVDFLAACDIEYLFMGPVGHTNLELLHATEGRDDVEVIMTKHELIAGYMACAYYRVTGKPGVVSTHTSPGLGNALNQFASSFLNSSVVVDLHTDSPADWRGQNAHHEFGWGGAYDMADPVTKETWDVTDPDKLTEAIPQAFSTAKTGRPGPVLVNLPMDVLAAQTDEAIPPLEEHTPKHPPRPSAEAIADALDALAAANRPVLLAGGGTIVGDAAGALREFVDAVPIPVATTDSAKGVMPEDDPRCVGVVGGSGPGSANEIVGEADLILGVGTRFGEFSTSAWTEGMPYRFPEQDLVQVDINPEEIGRYYPVDVGIEGDAAETLRALTEAVDDLETIGSESFVDRARSAVEAWDDEVSDYYELDAPLTMGSVIATLRDSLPRDAIAVADSGKNRGEMVGGWTTYEPNTILMDSGNGAMGYGPCAALGAQAAAPDTPVVSVSGDGGFVMVCNVLATAVEYDLPVKWVILNDHGFVSIAGIQEAYFGGEMDTHFRRADGAEYDIDFAAMAEAFGVTARRVSTPSGLEDAVDEMIELDGPYLLDAQVSREGKDADNGAQWVQAGRGAGPGETN